MSLNRTITPNCRDHLEKVFVEQDQALLKSEAQKLDLKIVLDQSEAQKKELKIELEQRENEKRELENDLEQIELQLQKVNQKAGLETKKADELVLWLGEERKKWEKENNILHRKVTELEKQLEVKKSYIDELEVKTNEIKEKLMKEKEDELEDIEALNQVLIVEGNNKNAELQEARHALIMGLKESASNTIGVKIMGDLEKQPFVAATKRINNSRKYRKRAADNTAAELCSLWEQYLRDPNWHPFKIITDKDGKTLEVIDEDDEKLEDLKTEFGDEVFEAVKTALAELNEYNPSGRYPVLELWNFRENRKATLAEGVSHLLNQMKPNKRRNVRPTSGWKPT
ncbi:hypothetical protein ABKV19_003476 [Rosa sericea]